MNMLQLENISKTFNKGSINENKVFDNFNINIDNGDFVCVVGSNGAGKSTFLNIVSGKVPVDTGRITLDKLDITREKEFERCKKISRIFQDPSLGTIPSMTIYENMSIAKNKGNSFGLSFLKEKKKEKYFKELLEVFDLGLEDKLHNPVSQLSGGQRQSLALLIAVLGNPELLLLDEHTAALDPKTSEIVMDITDKIVKEKNLTTLMITHNIDHAIKYGNRIVMFHRGEILIDLSGEEKERLTKEKLLSLFKDMNDRNFFS